MPCSLLFSLNNEGRIFALSTSGMFWKEFTYLGLEFKTLSAVQHFLWAVGGDRQIYLHVHGLDIPIKVREESYENERWFPIDGFSDKLLPTDRHHFSSQDGTMDRTINKIRLPSMAWQWDGDWHLEVTLEGEPLENDGWTYAVDFPATYYPNKQWKSCVRRRKWIRFRKYSAMDSWCAIAPLHADPTHEPFIDVSVGGHKMSHAPNGYMAVWAVTAHSRVMYRCGVSVISPEGLRWTNVATPPNSDVKQISVGARGLVWALLWTGRAIVRKGVTNHQLMGESWLEIKPPENAKLNLIAVGSNTVWALSADNRVWFRKGIDGNNFGISESAAMGSGWLEVGGNMSCITVAENDQIFAIGESDRAIYWREGVTQSELSGRKWKIVRAPLQVSRNCSTSSLQNHSPRNIHKSLHSLSESQEDDSQFTNDSLEASQSAPVFRTLPINPVQTLEKMSSSYIENFETPLKNAGAWSPVRSVGSVLGMEAHPGSETVFDDDSGLYCEDEINETAWKDYNGCWKWIGAGGCQIDQNKLPYWLLARSANTTADLTSDWRTEILKLLQERKIINLDLSNYGLAIEDKGWTRACEARFAQGMHEIEECIVSLHWMSTENFGTLSIFNSDGATIKVIINLGEINAVFDDSEPGSPKIKLISLAQKKAYFTILFNSELEQKEWLTCLSDILNEIHNLSSKINFSKTIWSVTKIGEIMVGEIQSSNVEKIEKKYVKEFTDLGSDLKNEWIIPLHNNFLAGSEVKISGHIHENLDRFSINLIETDKSNPTKADLKNVLFHFNPRFNQNEIICNAKISGEWGVEEKSNMPFVIGEEFALRIINETEGFSIIVKNIMHTFFKHRLNPKSIIGMQIEGLLKIHSIEYKSVNIILEPEHIYWKNISGHLKKVKVNVNGIVWGLGYDNYTWVYTGGNSSDKSDGYHDISDTKTYFVYENQRWNPLSGYTSSGLPTDRYMWSDITGKHKRTREHTKLLNHNWHWISEWIIDYNVPGGVDKDGWQYATDFPTPYHGKKVFTDCVRRRRWMRKAQLFTRGPWIRAGNTTIMDISFTDLGGRTLLWAVTSAGDAVCRIGVTVEQPLGTSWEHVSSPQPLCCIGGFNSILWAAGRKGEFYTREGISPENPKGSSWGVIEAPKYRGGVYDGGFMPVKCIAVSSEAGFAVLSNKVLAERTGLSQDNIFGIDWKYHTDHAFMNVAVNGREVWAVTTDGTLYRRLTSLDGSETVWQSLINAGFRNVSNEALIF